MAKKKIAYKNPFLEDLLETKGLNQESTWDIIADNFGSVQKLDFLTEHEKLVFKTFSEISQMEVVVQAGTGRASAFDTLIATIGTVLEADRTLGGLCDWVEAEAPRPVDLPVEGAASLKAAVIPVFLHYSTADPLA